MDPNNPHIREISEAIANKRLVPVVGAGVSASTARLPGWVSLVENGLNYVAGLGTHHPEDIDQVRQLLKSGETIKAAQGLKALLRAPGGEYRLWLRQTFRNAPEQVVSDRLIGAIRRLRCPLITTTNYDKLLSLLHMPMLEAVTWRSPALMHDALTQGDAVLHLHGVFDDLESVVFGEEDYETVVQRAPAYRDVLRTLWLDRTLLFIGCSFEGIEDPDFLNLLKWAAETFPGTAHKHYALVRNDSITPEVVARFLHDWRIQIVGYGDTYDDLAPFIESLNPNRDQASLTAYADAPGQQRLVVSGHEVLQIVKERESLQIRATTAHERYLQNEIERLRGLLNGGYTRHAQEGLARLIQEIEGPEHSGAASEMHGRVYLLAANAFMPVLSGGDKEKAEEYLSKARAMISSERGVIACMIAEARLLLHTGGKEDALAILTTQSHPDAKRMAFTIHLNSGDLDACTSIIEELSDSGALDSDEWHRLLATYYAEMGDVTKATSIIDKMVAKGDALDFSTGAAALFHLAYREYFATCRAHHICPQAHFASELGLDEFIDRTLEQRAIQMYERAADAYVSHDCLPEAAREILNALRLDVDDKADALIQRLERLEPDNAYLASAHGSGANGTGSDEDRQMARLRELLGSPEPDTNTILDLANSLEGSPNHAPAVLELLEANTPHFQTSDDTYVRYLYILSRLYTLVRTPAQTEAWLSGIEPPEQYEHLKAVFHIVFYSQHDSAKTAEWLEAALREYQDRPEILKLGMYYYGQIADDQDRALECARRLFQVLRTGRMASLLLEYMLASEKYLEIIQLAEENADLPVDERVLHRALGRAHSAESHFVEARQHLDWMRQFGHANLGDLLTLVTNCVYMGDLDNAVAVMNEAVARYPDEPRAYLMLSNVYSQRGDAGESYRVALEAYRRFPNLPEVALHLVNTGMATGQHADGAVTEAFRAFHPGGRFERTGHFELMPAEEGFNIIRAHRERAQTFYSQYAEGRSSLMMACHLQHAPLFRAHWEGVRFRQWRYAGIGAHLYDVAGHIQPSEQVVLDYSALLTMWSLYGDRWAHVLSTNYERVWISAKLLGILTWEYDLLRNRGQADRHQSDRMVRDAANQLYTRLRMLPRVDPDDGYDVIGEHTETTAARERDLPYLQEHLTDGDEFPGVQVVGLRTIADALVADGRISPQLRTQLVQHARNPLPGEHAAAQRLTPGSDIVAGITTLTTIALNGGIPALQAFLEYFGTIYYSEPAWQRLQGDIEEYERLRDMTEDLRRLREKVGDAITSGLLHPYTAPASLRPFPLLDPEPDEPESDRSQALDLLNTHVGYLNDVFAAGRAHSAPVWTDDRWTIKVCNGLAQDTRPPDVFGTDSFLLWNRLRTADDAEYYDSYGKLVRWRYLGLPLNADYLFWLVEQGYATDRGLVAEACAIYVQNVLHYVAPDSVLGAVAADFKQELLDSYGQNFVVLLHKCYRAGVPVERVSALVRLLDLTRQNVAWEMEPYHYYAYLLTEALAARGLELTIAAILADGDCNDSNTGLNERVANEGLCFMRWVESVLLASGVPEKVLFDAKLDMMSY